MKNRKLYKSNDIILQLCLCITRHKLYIPQAFLFLGNISPLNSVFIYCEFRLLGNSRDLAQWLRAGIQLHLYYAEVPEPDLSSLFWRKL